jgi:hypothetical protein
VSTEFWFRGSLQFADDAAIEAVKQSLEEEGCIGHADNLITDDDLKWSGRTLTVESSGSMPYSCFEISSFVLSLYAQHAQRGELITLNVEGGYGDRHLAGGSTEELDEATIAALRAEYGWESA